MSLKIEVSGMLCHAFWKIATNILEEPDTSYFRAEPILNKLHIIKHQKLLKVIVTRTDQRITKQK
jgi:hypothetical protein